MACGGAMDGLRHHRRKARGAAIVVIATVLVGGSIAMADWLVDGSGFGYAKSGTAIPLWTADVIPAGNLSPGRSGPVTVKIVNQNGYPVTLTGVTATGPVESSGPDCDGAAFLTFTDQLNLSTALPAKKVTTVTLPNAIAMSADAPNSCQGMGFRIPVA